MPRASLNESRIAEHRERMLSEVRATRLAEVRKRHDLSQAQLAERMGVSQARVSAIENGEVSASEVGTIAKYIAALGGKLQIVADFGDEKLARRCTPPARTRTPELEPAAGPGSGRCGSCTEAAQ